MTNNDVKEWCLKYIASRYPREQFNILKQIAELPESPPVIRDKIMLPINEDYPARLVVIMGVGDLSYLDYLIEQQEIKSQVKRFIIVENSPAAIRNYLHNPRFKNYLVDPAFKFILGVPKEQANAYLFNILKEPDFSRIMDLAQIFPVLDAPQEERDVYEYIASRYMETRFHVYHNYGRINDSLEGVRATLLNQEHLMHCPGIEDLKDSMKGVPAIVVAAGPSLDYQIENLKKYHQKAIIIAADAAVKPLLKHGIIPDYCTSIERGNLYQIPFWKDLPPIKTELVFFPVVHPEVLKLYPGPKRVVYRNYSYYAYFQKSWPKGIMLSGGSTTHLANRLAFHMGCSPVVLCGVDSTYEKHPTEDLFRSHCHGLGHEEWASFMPLKDFQTVKNHAPSFQVETYEGTGWTNITYHQWSKEFSEEVINLGAVGRLFTCSKQGVKIPGIAYTELSSIFEEVSQLKPEVPSNVKPVINRQFSNKVLLNNVTDWLEYVETFLKLADEIKTPSLQDVALAQNFLSHKFQNDHMFVGFVIQNCAAEFYQNANKWNSLSYDLSTQLSERLQVLKEEGLLYQQVLSKLKKVIENPQEEVK